MGGMSEDGITPDQAQISLLAQMVGRTAQEGAERESKLRVEILQLKGAADQSRILVGELQAQVTGLEKALDDAQDRCRALDQSTPYPRGDEHSLVPLDPDQWAVPQAESDS